ncbi:MAG: ATP-binding protein [Ruminiclostridium sp.]
MIFTVALWAIAIFLFCSDRHNKTNRWFAYCFFVTSIGTFKEFLVDTIVPILISQYPSINKEVYITADSCLTAILYLFTPFCVITLSMCFSDMYKTNKKLYTLVQFFTAFIIVVFLIFYSPTQFKFYQLNRKDFWYSMSAFNIGYAIIGSIVMFRNIKNETANEIKRRKRVSLEVFLLPYYYWLVTVFIIHSLELNSLKKIWKVNVYLVAIVLLLYVYLLYKEGFMGVRISFIKYDWNSQIQSVSSSTQYINHMLKNQATKINWSVDSIRKKIGNEQIEELDIIERSTKQLVNFTEKTNKCLSLKLAGDDLCGASNLIYEALEACNLNENKNVMISVECKDDVLIRCDAQSIVEVIYNILINAFEAIAQKGNIKVTAYNKKNGYCIEIIDNGVGIAKDQVSQLFLPFYTTKKTNINFGVGLPYCKNVMQAHEGSIEVYSNKDTETKFILHFPSKRVKRKDAVTNE